MERIPLTTEFQTNNPSGIWLSVLDQFCLPHGVFHLGAEDDLEEGLSFFRKLKPLGSVGRFVVFHLRGQVAIAPFLVRKQAGVILTIASGYLAARRLTIARCFLRWSLLLVLSTFLNSETSFWRDEMVLSSSCNKSSC